MDLLAEPNLIMTKMDPPLAIMASLWFYMTPQPPKPAMHDIILGTKLFAIFPALASSPQALRPMLTSSNHFSALKATLL